MRISDWSSDVCSSDLRDRVFVDQALRRQVCATLQRPCPMRTIDAVEQYHDRHIGEAGDTIRHEQADIRARAQRRAFHCHEAPAGWVDAGIRKLEGDRKSVV